MKKHKHKSESLLNLGEIHQTVTYDPFKYLQEMIIDEKSRFIMLFLESRFARSVFDSFIRSKFHQHAHQEESADRKLVFLEGSRFQYDRENKKYYIEVLRSIKHYIVNGDFVVFSKLENIYGILYNLFNQRFSVESKDSCFCEITYEDFKDRLRINPKFGCILLKDEDEFQNTEFIEKTLPSPLLNRFEKHLLQSQAIYGFEGIAHSTKFTRGHKFERFDLNIFKKIIREILQNEEIFKDLRSDPTHDQQWIHRGNDYIFSFHNGALIDHFYILWIRRLRLLETDPSKVDNKHKRKLAILKDTSRHILLRIKPILFEMMAYFTMPMLILLIEYIIKKNKHYKEVHNSDNQSLIQLSDDVAMRFLNIHQINSFDEFAETRSPKSRVKQNWSNKWVIFTKEPSLLQEYPLYEHISISELDSHGSEQLQAKLETFWEIKKNSPKQRGIIVVFENFEQSKHFEYLKNYIENWEMSLDDRSSAFEIGFIFYSHAASDRPNHLPFHVQEEHNPNWQFFAIDSLKKSFVR